MNSIKAYDKDVILTKNLEICIIELPKYKKYINNNKTLNTWVKFITNPGDIDMEDMNNKAVKKAKEVLDEISGDEREQELAFQRLMYKMDQDAVREAGYDKGKKDKALEIAKNMLKQNISIEVIITCTGLAQEEIKNLK